MKNPRLARSFFKLALLDGLSYNGVPKDTPGGPDGMIVPTILSMAAGDNEELALMQEACKVIIEISKQRNKKDIKTVTLLDSVTIPDGIALAGAAAIESVGGPILSTQVSGWLVGFVSRWLSGYSLTPRPSSFIFFRPFFLLTLLTSRISSSRSAERSRMPCGHLWRTRRA